MELITGVAVLAVVMIAASSVTKAAVVVAKIAAVEGRELLAKATDYVRSERSKSKRQETDDQK